MVGSHLHKCLPGTFALSLCGDDTSKNIDISYTNFLNTPTLHLFLHSIQPYRFVNLQRAINQKRSNKMMQDSKVILPTASGLSTRGSAYRVG
jgi:hypothetical protein